MNRILNRCDAISFTIILPGTIDEIDCKSSDYLDIREALRKFFDFRDITIKFLKKNQDGTTSFSDEPHFINDIAQFRVYRGSKFIIMGELRKWK